MTSIIIRAQDYATRLRVEYFQRYVFIHINKTGGSSIEKALAIRHEHKTASEKRDELGEWLWKTKFSFAIVRNPWDKVVSHYHFRVMTNQTNLVNNDVDFGTWVRLAYGEQDSSYFDNAKMFLPQLNWLTDADGKMLVNYVGRFESLEEEFKIICQKINKEGCTLPHIKKSNRKDYRQYYSDDTARIIGEHFRKDIDYFGYEF